MGQQQVLNLVHIEETFSFSSDGLTAEKFRGALGLATVLEHAVDEA